MLVYDGKLLRDSLKDTYYVANLDYFVNVVGTWICVLLWELDRSVFCFHKQIFTTQTIPETITHKSFIRTRVTSGRDERKDQLLQK